MSLNKNPAVDARAVRRIHKELERIQSTAETSGLVVEVVNQSQWNVHVRGAKGTLYDGELFVLQIHFTNDYPMDSPICIFTPPSPVHEHIYSNGHICLNILGDDWSPALTVESICLSILSMLSSAQIKIRPAGDERYSATHPPGSNPKLTRWDFHDDTV